MSAIKITATVYDYSKFDKIEIVEDGDYTEVVRDFIYKYPYTYEGKTRRLWKTSGGKDIIGGYVGVVRKRIYRYAEKEYDITLQIKSRFDKGSKPYFLETMLLDTFEENYIKENDLRINDDNFFDFLLVYLFKNAVTEASRKGVYRKYCRFEGNNSRLKGSIDIARHIRLNMGMQNGRIAYSYRENTIDNPLNRLIYAAHKRLKERFSNNPTTMSLLDSSGITNYLNILHSSMDLYSTNVKTILPQNLQPIAHPYYTEYEKLRQVCLKVFHDEYLTLFDPDQDSEADTILLYIPTLWENYLKNQFARYDLGIVEAQKERNYFYELSDPDKNERLTSKPDFILTSRPDFVFYKDNKDYEDDKPFMILDAKFKPNWGKCMKSPPDYSRFDDNDFNKCLRDMIIFETNRTGVIFPAYEKDTKTIYKECCIIENKYFYMHAVKVPESSDDTTYEEWHSAFTENLKRVCDKIRESIKNEA